MSAASTEKPEEIVAATRDWLEKAVIGLDLCPFARPVHLRDQIRYAVSEAETSASATAGRQGRGEWTRSDSSGRQSAGGPGGPEGAAGPWGSGGAGSSSTGTGARLMILCSPTGGGEARYLPAHPSCCLSRSVAASKRPTNFPSNRLCYATAIPRGVAPGR